MLLLVLILAKKLDYSYIKETPVFKDFNLELSDSFTGLIGINGAGKSTFLKLSLGLLIPTKGDITINGSSVLKNKQGVLQQVGVLFENPRFPSWARVIDYLKWVGTIRGLSESESTGQVDYILEKLDLLDRREEMVNNLSAGLKQRFGLAQAIIGIPDVIFLDEPTANLDVKSRIHVFEFLKDISKQFGIQVIIMSHILNDLERFCDSVAILHEGRIVYQDQILNLLKSEFSLEYTLRGINPLNLNEVLQNTSVQVLSTNTNETVIKVSDKREFEKIKALLPQGVVLIPYRSLLEQKFLEVTGEKR